MTWAELGWVQLGVVGVVLLVWGIVAGLRWGLRRWTVGWARQARDMGLDVLLERARPKQVPPIRLVGTYREVPVEVQARRAMISGQGRGAAYWVEVSLAGKAPTQHGGHRKGRALRRLLDKLIDQHGGAGR